METLRSVLVFLASMLGIFVALTVIILAFTSTWSIQGFEHHTALRISMFICGLVMFVGLLLAR